MFLCIFFRIIDQNSRRVKYVIGKIFVFSFMFFEPLDHKWKGCERSRNRSNASRKWDRYMTDLWILWVARKGHRHHAPPCSSKRRKTWDLTHCVAVMQRSVNLSILSPLPARLRDQARLISRKRCIRKSCAVIGSCALSLPICATQEGNGSIV